MLNAGRYIEKIDEICKLNETKCRQGGCPLFDYGCGLPKQVDKKTIAEVIKLVENYEITEGEQCKQCGFDFTTDGHESDEFCPLCGFKRSQETE